MSRQIPALKRITIRTARELDVWLASGFTQANSVMLVTHARSSDPQSISPDQMAQAMAGHEWKVGRRYTLGSGLLGQVISRP
ncbi:hypothetical protein ACUNV4_22110 [Granulosicoccus sp. 3-233]|uniref:hypothetical protein n=1 Tax=Granulosicoccus sp. 3-233 TaxID=3417969 RepID=UPI003D344213